MVKRMLPPDWAQKMLCIIVPNRQTASLEFFSWVRTWQLLSRHTCLARAPKKCKQSGNLQFDKLLISKFSLPENRNLGTYVRVFVKPLYQKYKLELTTGIQACINHAFVNIRKFQIPQRQQALKSHVKSEFEFFHSLSWFNTPTCLLCKGKWTLLELNSYQPYPSLERERKFCYCLFTYSTKREIRHFHVVACSDSKKMCKKSMMQVQSCWFALSSLLLFWYLVIGTKQNFLGANWWGMLLLIASKTFFRLIGSSFLVRRVESFPCTHNLDERTGQVWRENSRRVRTDKKNSRDAVCWLGKIIQRIFGAQSGASIC